MTAGHAETSETSILAGHCARLKFSELPDPVVRQAKAALRDCLGVGLYVSAQTSWGRVMREFAVAEGYGARIATIFGAADMTTPARAALANGTFAQGFEFEDVHVRSPGHPECCVVPSALAVAELVDASGEDLLCAIVAGCEVMVRVGLGSGVDVGHRTLARGLFPQPMYGIFGAAASAAHVLRLESDCVSMAFGLAGEQAYGTLQSTTEGVWSKRWHTGRVAEAGVSAALLVRAGFLGPKHILEGKFGLYKTHNLAFDPMPLVRPFLAPFEIMDLWFKRYPCWGVIHGAVEALLDLMDETPFSAREVMWIEGAIPVFSSPEFLRNVEPTTVMAAQTSLPYCLAAIAVHRRLTPAEFTEAVIKDSDVLELARKVRVLFDEELEARRQGGLNFGGRVTVRLRDGRELRHQVDLPTGHPKKPLSEVDMRQKFMSLAPAALGPAAAEILYQSIQSIEDCRSVREFMKLLRPTVQQ